jgi:hypothetical protein
MGFISKLFGRSKTFDENSKAAQPVPSSYFLLAHAIVDTAYRSAKRLDPIIKFPNEKEKRYQAFWVSFAFAIFFSHMMLRTVFGRFGPAARDKVLKALGPFLIEAMAKSFTGPDEALAKFRSELWAVAQEWEIEYSRCEEILSDPKKADAFTGNSVLSSFTRNVLERSGYEVPQIEPKESFRTYADFIGAGGKMRCRYSTNPQQSLFEVPLVLNVAITELESLSLPDRIDKLVSVQ